MATVDGMFAGAIRELIRSTLVNAALNADGQLILTNKGGETINAGSVGTNFVSAVVNTAGRLVMTRRNGQTVDVGFVAGIKALDAWPVGSIFFTTAATSPTTLFGGTWVAWGSGRVPVSVNTSDIDFASVERIGGAKEVPLTEPQIPYHAHTMAHTHSMAHTHEPPAATDSFVINRPGATPNRANGSGWHATTFGNTGPSSAPSTGASSAPVTGPTGQGVPHPNLQPYITCYMWKRTA